LEQFLGLKILKFFDADPRFGIILTLDLGYGMEKFGSGINILDPQLWVLLGTGLALKNPPKKPTPKNPKKPT
jgi:hypothetical protein